MKLSSNNTIIIALLLSVVVHGVLFLGDEHARGDMSVQQVAAVTVQVELMAPVSMSQDELQVKQPISEKVIATPEKVEAEPETQKESHRQIVPATKVEKPVEADVVSDYSDAQPTQKHQQVGQRADELRKFVYEAINREKHYPYMARRQRREGMVKLNFVMHPNGKVTDIAIVQSSRFAVLDKAAKRAVEAISPFHLASQYLTMQQHYDVGIDFRLN